MTILDFASNLTPAGVASFAAGELLTRAFADDVIQGIVSLAGGPDLDLHGLDLVDRTGMVQAGGIGSNSENEKAQGGAPLSLADSLALRTEHISERKRAFASRPLKDRLFDYTHPDSMATAAITNMPQNKQQLAVMLSSAPQKMLASIAAIMSPAVRAQQQGPCDGSFNAACLNGFDNYGIQDYGYTNEEVSYLTGFNPDELVEWADGTENAIGTPPDSETRTKWGDCFDAKTEPKEGESKEDGPVNSGGWSEECQGYLENDSDRTFLAFRGALKYRAIQEALECAGATDCPKSSGSGSSAAQTPGGAGSAPGVPGQCATGSVSLGEHEFWEKKVASKGTLCQITGWPSEGEEDVAKRNSLVAVRDIASQKWMDLYNAAKADGINLRATSSYRSYAKQAELFAANPDPAAVARPGESNHNGGYAIDLLDMCFGVSTCPRDKKGGVYDKSMNCEATGFIRSIDPSSKAWMWMEKNAKRFGVTQYCNEAWHWETKVYDGG